MGSSCISDFAGSLVKATQVHAANPLLGGTDIFNASCRIGLRKLITSKRQHALRARFRVSALASKIVRDSAPSSAKEARGLNEISIEEESGQTNGGTRVFKFYQAGGKEVITTVTHKGDTYKVNVVLSLEEENLYMQWNIFRSRFSDWGGELLKDLPAGTTRVDGAYQTLLQKVESCAHCMQLEFASKHAPFFMEFRILKATNGNSAHVSSRDILRQSHYVFPVGCGRGSPDPLGISVRSLTSVNFALYSKQAAGVSLCLYHAGSIEPSVEIEFQSSVNKTGSTWHIELDGSMYDRYGYRCRGESSWEAGSRFHARRILLDPYARTLAPFVPGQDSLPSPALVLGSLSKDNSVFEWDDDLHPDIPLEELVAYRLNVNGFTADSTSGLQDDEFGTFDGLFKKAHHFVSLGVNCIILQPIFFYQKKKSSYYPLSFFAPMDSFGSEKTCASSSYSLKKAIKELHKQHIEVLLDVVFSPTGENNDEAPETISFRGIDNATYYILDQDGRVTGSELGAENSFNCNHPVVHTML